MHAALVLMQTTSLDSLLLVNWQNTVYPEVFANSFKDIFGTGKFRNQGMTDLCQ